MRKLMILMTLIVLLWELLDPSTSFVRRADVSGARPSTSKQSVSAQKRVMSTKLMDQSQVSAPDDASHGSPLFDSDTIHHCCAVIISAFDIEPTLRILFVGRAKDLLAGPAAAIFQPPKQA